VGEVTIRAGESGGRQEGHEETGGGEQHKHVAERKDLWNRGPVEILGIQVSVN